MNQTNVAPPTVEAHFDPPDPGMVQVLPAPILHTQVVATQDAKFLQARIRNRLLAIDGYCPIGSEIEPSKCAEASRNLDEASLAEFSEVREGDALETLDQVPEPVDLVLLDGAKHLYLPVLRLLQPRLRPGAVVLADNIHTFRRSLRPYVEYVQSPSGGFVSTTLSMGHGFEYSVFLGRSRDADDQVPDWAR